MGRPARTDTPPQDPPQPPDESPPEAGHDVPAQTHTPEAPPAVQTVPLVNDRGVSKNYETVASRLARFRHALPSYAIEPEIISVNDEVVRMRVRIGMNYTTPDGMIHVYWLATGHAEEYRSTEGINATSALENCETSALGRALAIAGFASPESLASADEVRGAKAKAEVISKAQPGALLVVQNAAKKGTDELRRVWEKTLSEDDRNACRGFLAKLKKEAAKVDDDKAHGIKPPDNPQAEPAGQPAGEYEPPPGP